MHSCARLRLRRALVISLILLSGGGAVVRPAKAEGSRNQLVLPRLTATVVALDPHGLATVQTEDGAIRQVVRASRWQVGDQVTCEQYTGESPASWWTLDCRNAF
jgi:hypothetical protein